MSAAQKPSHSKRENADSPELRLPIPRDDDARPPFARFWMKVAPTADVLAAALLLGGAAVAFFTLPAGSWVRVAITVPAVLVVPGYLLLRALGLSTKRPRGAAWWDAALAMGISPALVGLLALSTALVPGGFRPEPIVIVILAACALLALAALLRGALLPPPNAQPVAAPEPERRR